MKQPEALRLAEMFDSLKLTVIGAQNALPMEEAAAELRRLHEVNQELVEALEQITKVEYQSPVTMYQAMEDIAKAALAKARGTE
jgi:hypothetical protein